MEEEKTENNNKKIVVCIEEYPSIKNESDGKDSPTIKKMEKVYDLPSSDSQHDVGNGNEVEAGYVIKGLEKLSLKSSLEAESNFI